MGDEDTKLYLFCVWPWKVGIDIVRRALQTPARQIVENAGADGSVVIGKLLERGDANYGYDAQIGSYTDMVKAGIIDPTKVVRLALQGAASIAALLITTEAMVADKPGKSATPSMPGGGMGGMGDMDYRVAYRAASLKRTIPQAFPDYSGDHR